MGYVHYYSSEVNTQQCKKKAKLALNILEGAKWLLLQILPLTKLPQL